MAGTFENSILRKVVGPHRRDSGNSGRLEYAGVGKGRLQITIISNTVIKEILIQE